MSIATEYIPQTGERMVSRRPLVAWGLFASGTLVFIAAVFCAPILASHGYFRSAQVIYNVFSRVCHQIPQRSYFIEDHPLAVCARCTGLYLGFAAVVLTYPLIRSLRYGTSPWRGWLFLAAVPCAIDFTLGFLGIWENTHLSRFITGALLGAVSVLYVMPGVVELAATNFRGILRRN